MSDEKSQYDIPEQRHAYEQNLPICTTCGAQHTVEWIPSGNFGNNFKYEPGLEYCSNPDCETRWSH